MREAVDEGAVVDLTRQLVAIDTRNPPGNERDAIGVCREALEPFGARFSEIEPKPGRASLIAEVGVCDGSRPTLIVNGHLDVVPIDVSAWTHDPFGGDLDDGRLYGRGTSDMKGGIAAAVEAMAALRRAGREPACDVVFHLVADEERGGQVGTKVLADEGLIRGDACLVPEPTSLDVCVAERGLVVVNVTTHGTPAHGSNPRDGVSAIETAAKVVLALHATEFAGEPHPLLGRPTANVGTVEGGSGHNTVAEGCRLAVDRRLLPGITSDAAVAEIREKIDAIDDPDLRYDLEVEVFGEASEMDPAHPFVEQVRSIGAGVLGREPELLGMPFATDARFVRNQAGIPAVVCGPGGLAQAHVHDEYVEVESLVNAAAIYAELLATFGTT